MNKCKCKLSIDHGRFHSSNFYSFILSFEADTETSFKFWGLNSHTNNSHAIQIKECEMEV